ARQRRSTVGAGRRHSDRLVRPCAAGRRAGDAPHLEVFCRNRAILEQVMTITVLVANPKGGCGKTTIATHLAAAFAGAGLRTGLADADRQGSSLGWLKARPQNAAPIQALDWRDGPDQPQSDLDRLILDAPAALKLKKVEELLR